MRFSLAALCVVRCRQRAPPAPRARELHIPPLFPFPQAAASAQQAFKSVNYTSFTDAACAAVAKAPKEYKVGACHKGTTYSCAASASGAIQANETSYNDAACASYNSSKIFDSGVCTQTGPKSARTSKLVTCVA